jgi:thiol-disulfide isomerase/thioredoxin
MVTMAYSQLLKPASQNRYLQSPAVYYIAAIALSATILLSIISWMRLCSQACAEGHQYRLYGFTFETVGLISFPLMLGSHLLSRWYPIFISATACMLAAAMGAEVMFIYVQKYMIGSWCPVCLLIAASILTAATAYFYEYFHLFKQSIEREDRGQVMNNIYKGLSAIIIFAVGFIFAFSGVGKYNQLQADENAIKEKIAFGNSNSGVEVYIFTDWACPACRSLESSFEAMAPNIMKKAKLTFVDDPVHSATLNYSPYNLSFMINNKANYLQLRSALGDLSEETKTPTDEQVEKIARKLGVTYRQLNYADVALGSKYFNHLVEKLEVEGTPTIVIVSKSMKKGKKLAGTGEISEANVLKAIDALSK